MHILRTAGLTAAPLHSELVRWPIFAIYEMVSHLRLRLVGMGLGKGECPLATRDY